MDNERDRMAERLMHAEMGHRTNPFYPSRIPKLSDLWPCDQEKYRRMADAAWKTANGQAQPPEARKGWRSR